MIRLALVACVALVVPRAARADQPIDSALPFGSAARASKLVLAIEKGDIVIETPGERSLNNELVIGGIAGAGVLISAVGLYFHLDGRSAASDVSADSFTGKAWTSEKDTLVDKADRDRTRAIALYSVGGALIAGAIVAWIITEPKSETAVIHPHGRGSPTVEPTTGGAVLGGLWSF